MLEVGCCMHINPPSFVQRLRHFGDYNPCHLKVTSRTKWSIFLVIKCWDRKATERVYVGGKDTEGVEDGPDSADMEDDRGCA